MGRTESNKRTEYQCRRCHESHPPDGSSWCKCGGRVVRIVVVTCCDHEIHCTEFTNTCKVCGADYNPSGDRLGPRSQWGCETGESLSDILSVGHNIE